jgi:hypothetical protein
MATGWADSLAYRNWEVFHMSRRLWLLSAQKVLSSIDNKIAEGLASDPFLHRHTARDRVFRGCTNGIVSVETRRVQDAYIFRVVHGTYGDRKPHQAQR